MKSAQLRGEGTGLQRLGLADSLLAKSPWRTLAPRGGPATPLSKIVVAVVGADGLESEAATALADALGSIALAMRRAFPENIFGDLEYLAASLWRGAERAPVGAAAHLRTAEAQIVALQERFGGGTTINFRYAHDFLYGFDWAKWVARDPQNRASVGPFDPPFLLYTARRGAELVELIATGGDTKYPPLPDARPRNPFGFSRQPDAEVQLHLCLAREGLLPVQAWEPDAAPDWDRPFARLRLDVARRLGLAESASSRG